MNKGHFSILFFNYNPQTRLACEIRCGQIVHPSACSYCNECILDCLYRDIYSYINIFCVFTEKILFKIYNRLFITTNLFEQMSEFSSHFCNVCVALNRMHSLSIKSLH